MSPTDLATAAAQDTIWVDWSDDGRAFECRIGAQNQAGGERRCTLVARQEATVRPPVLAALLSSRLMGFAYGDGEDLPKTLAQIQLPKVEGQYAMQLEVLWRRFERASDDERGRLRAAFDRIAAELYDLPLDTLINFERAQSIED